MEEPTQVTIAGRLLRCPHCQNDRFFQRSWQLNTTGLTFFNLDWLNPSASNYVCSVCGRIEWFTDPPGKEVMSSTTDGDSECLECGAVIPHGATNCPKCGWTYT